MKKILALFPFFLHGIFVLFSFRSYSQDTYHIEGIVTDYQTSKGLPFAAVQIKGTSVGTSTNMKGEFYLKIPFGYRNSGVLLFSYIGFESTALRISNVQEHVEASLKSSEIVLEAVTVRPVTAMEYLKRVISKLPENYANKFSANAYFRQYGSDNDQAIQLSEGYMQVFVPAFLFDTAEVQQRMLLYNKQDNLDQVIFRKRKREKKIEMDLSISNLKGMQRGKIYLDQETEAIVGIDQTSQPIIPVAARPLIFLAGYGIFEPIVQKKVRYIKLDGKWFPYLIQFDMEIAMTKRYWFKKNERSNIDLEILMTMSNINYRKASEIPRKYQFNAENKIEDQVYPINHLDWQDVSRIPLGDIY